MRPLPLLVPLLLAGCATGISYQGVPIEHSVTGGARRLNDGAYSAGARLGQRLGLSPPADTPAAGVWQERR